MAIGPWQLLIIGIVFILLFGRGKISNLMGELGSGITDFKKGLAGETEIQPKDLTKNSTK